MSKFTAIKQILEVLFNAGAKTRAGAGLYFNSGTNPISEFEYLVSYTVSVKKRKSFRFAVTSGSVPTTARVAGVTRKARCETGSNLPFLCLACCLTHFGRTGQRMGGAEVRMGRGGMIQQGNRPCSVVWPLAAAERPQMQ